MTDKGTGYTTLRYLGVIATVFALLVAVFALQACSTNDTAEDAVISDETADEDADATQEDEPSTEEAPQVEYHKSDVEVAGTEVAVITTPKGVIKFEFFPDKAPNTCATFIELADMGYFDGIKFHRVEPGFVIQGGDPLSRDDDPMVGTGGPEFDGVRWLLEAEFNDLPHVDGSVAMARSTDPNSAGSQFYITMGPQPFLDGQYTVFGQVVEGLDVVYQIAVGDVMESVVIERVE